MGFLDDIKSRILIYDGSKGYMLQLAGLPAGGSPEEFILSHPDTVFDIHAAYVEAGCDVIQTNTFTGNRVMLEKHGLGDFVYEINHDGAALAKKAAAGKAYTAASVGPTGLMFSPFGTLEYEEAFDVFKEQVGALVDGGVDLINFETFTDISEMRAALAAARSLTGIPVICSMAFEHNKRTLMGTDPLACARILLAAGADMAGANCSFGPGHMLEIVKEMAVAGSLLSVKPNAGLPQSVDGVTVYSQCAADFAKEAAAYGEYNVRLVGGCCGTTPEYIAEIKRKMVMRPYAGPLDQGKYLCSVEKSVPVNGEIKIGLFTIGEGLSVDDTIDGIYDMSYGDYEALELEYNGSNEDFLAEFIKRTRGMLKLPLIFSGKNNRAVENALRIYPGIAGVRKKPETLHGYVILDG
ncbi:MAG: homocysteine S-methyltransferase family protein [Clostridia bacterium]|nr:homocysteine S-methyltransferase family protein [Clostridia bacterium]